MADTFPDSRREQFAPLSLPSNDDAERLVLGAVFMDEGAISTLLEHLTADDFYSARHRAIFLAMTGLLATGASINPISVAEQMKLQGTNPELFGGVPALTNLTYGLPYFDDAGLVEYCVIVKDKSKARNLIKLCNEVMSETLTEEEPIGTIIERAEQKIFALANVSALETEAQLHPLMLSTLHEKQEQVRQDIRVTGMPTGLAGLDRTLGGYHKANLVLVGGRPSMGKTALVVKSMLDGILRTPGAVGLFFSAEMSKREIVARIICQYADMNLWRFNHNHIRDMDWQHLHGAAQPFDGIPFYVDDTPAISTMQMLAKARRLKSKHKRLDIIGVDHIGLMSPANRKDSRVNQISQISADLKGIAKILDIPVLALSQLSRASEGRNPPIPIMADLRDSGSLEQDADVVMFVYRPDYYDRDPARKQELAQDAQIIVAKQRNGPTETVPVQWIAKSTRFADLDTHGEE